MVSGKFPESGVRYIVDADQAIKEFDKLVKRAADVEKSFGSFKSAVKISVNDADLKAALDVKNDLDSNVAFNVDANTSDAESSLDDIAEQLSGLQTLGVIDLVLGNLPDLTDLESIPIVGSIFEMDAALAQVEGRAGRMIPQAEELIQDLYTGAWGESITQISEVVTAVTKLGIANEDLEDASKAAFMVMDVTGGDVTETVRALDSLVTNNLAPNYQAAADLIVAGFQEGADKGEDLLDTFTEYGSTFATLRISGGGALAIINSGLEAGIDNSDRIADAMREVGIRLREMGTDPNIEAAFTRLDELSDVDLAASFNAYQAGQISGDEFFGGFFQALRDVQAIDPQAGAEIQAALIGTISEDFGPNTIAALSPEWDSAMGDLEGRAETASNRVNDTLGVAITSLTRTIEVELANALNTTFDIDGLIDKAKGAIQTFFGELESGTGVGEALEITLGLNEGDIRRLESVFTAFLLGLGDVVAGFLDLVGQGEAASGVRAALMPIAQQRLDLEIELAGIEGNAERLSSAINDAMARGISPEDAVQSVGNAIQSAAESGDFDFAIDLAGAAEGAFTGTTFEDVFANAGTRIADKVTEDFNAAITSGDFQAAKTLAEGIDDPTLIAQVDQMALDIDAAWAEIETGATTLSATVASQYDLSKRSSGDAARKITEDGMTMEMAMDDTAGGAIRMAEISNPAFLTFADIGVEAFNRTADAAFNATQKINEMVAAAQGAAEVTLNPITGAPVGGMAVGGSLSAGRPTLVGEAGPEIFTAGQSGSIINAANTSLLMGALQGLIGGPSVTNIINVNQTMNSNSTAQAERFGLTTARTVRGFM